MLKTSRTHADPAAVGVQEWLFVVLVGTAVLAISSVPYLVGALSASDERVFVGFVYGVEDCLSYVAKMRQGADGAWLFHLPYTSEPHPGSFIYIHYLLLGKLAALLPGGTLITRCIWVYHAARLVFGMLLLIVTYQFLAALTDHRAVRRLAWLMIAFGGGIGWLLLMVGRGDWLGSAPLDFYLPEGFTFLILYAFPHLALAGALLLSGMVWLLRAEDTRGRAKLSHLGGNALAACEYRSGTIRTRGMLWAACAGGAWLLMGLIVPFYVGVAWAVLGATLAVRSIRRRRILWRSVLELGLAVLISLPVVAYSGWLFTSEAVYATWAAQNLILSPHPLHFLVAYGILLALAGVALVRLWRRRRTGATRWLRRPLLPLVWVALVPLLIYLPFNLQRRMIVGAQIPLSLFAAIALVGNRWRGVGSRIALVLTLAVLSLSNAVLVGGTTLALRGQPSPVFRDAGEVAALDWLAQHAGKEDVVLTTYDVGNYLPARASARTFLGHGLETVRADDKRLLVARFFGASTDDTWRRQFLAENRVDYVIWQPDEMGLGAANLRVASYLHSRYDANGYVVFSVD
jgi:hypothetical protein